MYVLPNWTFTPDVGGYDQIVIPGVYAIEQFAEIENATKNTTLYTSTNAQHLGTIAVSDDGSQTTILVWPSDPVAKSTDQIRLVMYDPAPTGSGPTSNVAVTNWPVSQNVNGTVNVGNFPATQPVSGTVTANQGTSPWVTSVSNFPATQAVTGTFWQATQPVSGTITANQGTSPWIVSSTGGSTNIAAFPATSTDAFGRLRMSQPFTLFDSSHRYSDNNLWATSAASGGAAVFNAAQGLVDLNVTTASGSQVLRETTKVFSYQPGKSLQVLTTFVMNAPKVGLTQRTGYYNVANGYFLELNDTLNSLCFVERSSVSGSVVNTRVSQLGGVYGAGDTGWNVDPMDGSGPSGITLDITKAQILWMDLEWLGVGTVRMGFIIDGVYYICHEWQHANLITSTYITTASLPLRCEVLNTATTASASTFKQICSTVISEGGYTLAGLQQAVATPITAPRTFTVAGTYYPIISIRLKPTRLDAIVVLSAISILGNGNNERFQWQVVASGTTTGGSWLSAGANSSVDYNLTGTSFAGGRILASGFTSSSNQGSPSVDILKQALFAFQLERDPFTATPYEITILMAGANNTTSAYASMDWEEITR